MAEYSVNCLLEEWILFQQTMYSWLIFIKATYIFFSNLFYYWACFQKIPLFYYWFCFALICLGPMHSLVPKERHVRKEGHACTLELCIVPKVGHDYTFGQSIWSPKREPFKLDLKSKTRAPHALDRSTNPTLTASWYIRTTFLNHRLVRGLVIA